MLLALWTGRRYALRVRTRPGVRIAFSGKGEGKMGQQSFEFDRIPEVEKKSMEEKLEKQFPDFEVISTYSREQAIEDGVLVYAGDLVLGDDAKIGVCFTSNLFAGGGYEDLERRKWLVNHGVQRLKEKDPEDSPSMRLRVLEDPRDPERPKKIWVILNSEGITFLRPEDY
jgi:hypothetical protein